eukprot:5485123-Amphidinium_carterae.1
MDYIGMNKKPVADSLTLAELDWQTIIQRLWPQELNFFHIDAPTRRRHCIAHYQAATVSEEEYRFMALQAGLPDEKKAFSDAQELGAWTMDLLWNEVLNCIDRVTAYTCKDDPNFKLKKKENVKGYRVVPQAQYSSKVRQQGTRNTDERLANYFETGATFALFQRDLYAIRRLLIALISQLGRKDEEAFWQWYPAYGYQFPHYNTVTDRAQREIFSNYDDWEIPFTSADLPEGFFQEKPEPVRNQERTIPVVPEFVAGDRPVCNKPAYPDYHQRCAEIDPDTVVRQIAEDWMGKCWNSKEHDHGYYTFKDHRKKLGWYGWVSQKLIDGRLLEQDEEVAMQLPEDRTFDIDEVLQEDDTTE